jgi:hypothetical protein
MLFFGGLFVTAEIGWLPAALLTAVGGVAWLAGHWVYAVRHHYFFSPLARRIFVQVLPRQLDPTVSWFSRRLIELPLTRPTASPGIPMRRAGRR